MQIRRLGADAGERQRRVPRFDGRRRPLARTLLPLRPFGAALEQQKFPRRLHGQQRRRVRLAERVVRFIVEHRGLAESEEADLCRLAPAAEQRQAAAAFEQPRCVELDFRALVAGDRVAAADVDVIGRTDVVGIPGAEGEAAAAIGAFEEGMPLHSAAGKDRFGLAHQPFARGDLVGMECLRLFGLRLLDRRFAGRRFGRLRSEGGRESTPYRKKCEHSGYTDCAHRISSCKFAERRILADWTGPPPGFLSREYGPVRLI